MLSQYERDQLQVIADQLTVDDPDLAELLSGRRFRRAGKGFRAARKARRERKAALARLEQVEPSRVETSPLRPVDDRDR